MFALMKFLKFLNLEQHKDFIKTNNKEKSSNSQELIEINEDENIMRTQTQSFIEYADNAVIEHEIVTEIIPVGKNKALKVTHSKAISKETKLEKKVK